MEEGGVREEVEFGVYAALSLAALEGLWWWLRFIRGNASRIAKPLLLNHVAILISAIVLTTSRAFALWGSDSLEIVRDWIRITLGSSTLIALVAHHWWRRLW